MTKEEFGHFWMVLTAIWPWDYRGDGVKAHFAELFKPLPLGPALRSIKTYTNRPAKENDAPTAEYLAYLTRECNGAPDLLYKAVQQLKANRRNVNESVIRL